jgi:hypothetical protein
MVVVLRRLVELAVLRKDNWRRPAKNINARHVNTPNTGWPFVADHKPRLGIIRASKGESMTALLVGSLTANRPQRGGAASVPHIGVSIAVFDLDHRWGEENLVTSACLTEVLQAPIKWQSSSFALQPLQSC